MAATVRGGSIYCEAVLPPEDVFFEGSEDEDYENAAERRKRYEAAGQKFLSGSVPFLLSASLKGPFDEASGWVNPWRSKNRTAHPQPRLESPNLASQCTHPTRPVTSASVETQAIEVLKNAECALPSPESLKQAPFTATPSRLRGKVAVEDGWGNDMASLTSTKNDTDPWVASSPSRKLRKKRSKSSIGVSSASKKRRTTRSEEMDISTPTTPGRRATASNSEEQRTNIKDDKSDSIYAHIRELTSKLPRQGHSSDEDILSDDDDSEAFLTSQSVASPSRKLALSPWRVSPNEPVRRRLNPPSSFSSPPPRSSLFGALSPVSMSSAQTPTKRALPPASSPGRLPSMTGLSPSRTPTRRSRIPDQDMPDADDNHGGGANGIISRAETQSQEQELPSLKPLDTYDVDHTNDTPDLDSRAATASRSNREEPASTPDEATTSRSAQDDSMRGQKASHEKINAHIKPMRATPPRQVTHPIIYDEAEGVNRPSPSTSIITARSSSQQPAKGQNEVTQSSRDSKFAKTNGFPKSSALQSLSPRNGRINSRPALKKAVRSYMSSPLRPSASSANRSLLHTENSQQSKENVETKEANETLSPPIRNDNITTSQPTRDEVLATSTPEADSAKVDKTQECDVAPDAASSSTASPSSLAPSEVIQPTGMENTVQGHESSNVPGSVEPIVVREELPTQPRPSISTTDAGPGTPAMQASGDTSEMPDGSDSTGPMTDVRGFTQEQHEQTLAPVDSGESLVLPPQSVETHQPPSEDMPPPSSEVLKRPSTPEPQFAFTSFSSFMSPSPSHGRQVRYSWDGVPNGIGPTSRGILLSGKKGASGSTASKKRVSWAPLPHEETASAGEEVSSETNTSSSPSRGRERAVSPPPPPSTGLASDSLEERDMKFSHHFAAVADRCKGTQLQSAPTASGDGSCSHGPESPVTAGKIASWAEITNSPQVNLQEAERGAAKLTGGWDGGEESTDIVEDIFNEMDDFLQIWDVDAELKEARKADKARAAGEKKQDETMPEVDMGMDVDMDAGFTPQFFF
ncbi:uncharacterized protein TRIREDRAFT_112052 [Trichoderma reesei QM6a]|uniref:Predicted protein n=2 Tax=Hypocrea jecorina TaxID=51453 RepID=G0RW29_HYPJQ|nr:uncharacterized protein TRIREDRAFT_112052 [Trichoderma reesei QM6a]EGR44569.1 predicted protein [Trichoderma reesei QM6a]ETR97538.1 hypothetical protein M419DRAFT_134421 [Trichoderma reesei RUT C-30]